MLQNAIHKFKKKSLKERFLLFIGILFFLIYLTLGLIIIFWEAFPINLETKYRIAFGVLLITYSGLRFLRFFNDNKDN
jgi:cytochrome c biogenesis protein CcdA